MRQRFLPAGETHGPALHVNVEGLPAGVPVDRVKAFIFTRSDVIRALA